MAFMCCYTVIAPTYLSIYCVNWQTCGQIYIEKYLNTNTNTFHKIKYKYKYSQMQMYLNTNTNTFKSISNINTNTFHVIKSFLV